MAHIIIDACIDPAGRDDPRKPKNGEWVLLELFGSIINYTLKHTENPGTPHERLAVLYHFRTEAPASTRYAMVHSGTGTPHLDKDGTWHVYAEDEVGAGRWKLNNGGEHLVLENPNGQVVHEKRFAAHHCGKPKIVVPPVVVAAPAFGTVKW
jgi:hypothetical protein